MCLFLQLILALRSRAVQVVRTGVAVVHGTEGTSRSCLTASLVVGPASGVSGNFSLLTSCGGE